MITLI